MLRSALDDNRITAHYQPVIELSTGSVCGFEALARIAEHDGSIVAPAAFITIAEQSGLVVPLGTRVLEMACHEASDLAGNLGLRSIAEGVEASFQLDRLRQLGCDQAQGYLVARPLPPDDVAAAILHAAW